MNLEHLTQKSSAPFFLIAGPCVIESPELLDTCAARLVEITSKLKIPFVFKASFDKANRSSIDSFRGPGLTAGLEALAAIKARYNVPIVTDIHTADQAEKASEVADILQIPAFLCRQTDLIEAAAKTGKIVNIKKGQFLAPWDMEHVLKKAQNAGAKQTFLTERGTSFGYNNLVVDFRGLEIMKDLGAPVIFDATHAVQLPGGSGTVSGGQRQYVPTLARAAVAVGVNGLFMETHPNPEQALSDGPNAMPLDDMEDLLTDLLQIAQLSLNRG